MSGSQGDGRDGELCVLSYSAVRERGAAIKSRAVFSCRLPRPRGPPRVQGRERRFALRSRARFRRRLLLLDLLIAESALHCAGGGGEKEMLSARIGETRPVVRLGELPV